VVSSIDVYTRVCCLCYDSHKSSFREGGGGYGGGGHGGGYGGGRGGPPVPQVAQNLVVKTNLFGIDYSGQDQTAQWYKYKIVVTPKKGRKDKDRDVPIESLPDAHPQKTERFQKKIADGSTEQTRELLLKLSEKVMAQTGILLAVSASVAYGIVLRVNFWYLNSFLSTRPILFKPVSRQLRFGISKKPHKTTTMSS
jgi:hypothetical protein